MLNYPEGCDNEFAPWNAPCTDNAHGLAIKQVTGDDLSLTTETLGEFLAGVTDKRTGLLSETPVLIAPISSAELLKVMLNPRNGDSMVAAATRELTLRYLADQYTREVVEAELDRVMGVAA